MLPADSALSNYQSTNIHNLLISSFIPFTKLVDKEEDWADCNDGHLFPVDTEVGGGVLTGMVLTDKADPERKHGRNEETLSEVVYH